MTKYTFLVNFCLSHLLDRWDKHKNDNNSTESHREQTRKSLSHSKQIHQGKYVIPTQFDSLRKGYTLEEIYQLPLTGEVQYIQEFEEGRKITSKTYKLPKSKKTLKTYFRKQD